MDKKFWDYGELAVGPTGRYLANGERPFFWLGDTAWLLFQKCSLAEARAYLKNRKEKHYSVIQASLIHALKGDAALSIPGEGEGSVYTPDQGPAFWEHCRQIVSAAEELGIYLALLPCWGSYVRSGDLDEEKALRYADFLKETFSDFPNIIWILGGDVRGDTNLALFNRYGARMRENFPHCLIGFHPFGRTSSALWFHEEAWLDFNMFQSGHRRYDQAKLNAWDDASDFPEYFGEDNWKYADHALALSPKKPVLDGEPSYEWIPKGLHDPKNGYWQSCDVRRYAYWSVFEGSMGHTYGDNSIMQFYRPGQGAGSYGVIEYWTDAVHHEGSGQMKYLADLMTGVDFTAGRANDARISGGQREKYDRIAVFEGPDYLFAYTYLGKPFALDLSGLPAMEARWMDPATGVESYLGRVDTDADAVFTPPPKYHDGTDWVLTLRAE